MSRVDTLLARLPAHLEADRPGKLLYELAAALARNLDVQAAQLAGIRRAHRLAEADEFADLFALAALHGIRPGELDSLTLRFARAEARLAVVLAAGDHAAALSGAEALLELWGLDLAAPRLAAFAEVDTPDLAGGDGAAALDRLAVAAGAALTYPRRIEAARTRIQRICARHAGGNGTIAAVLEAAAIALDLDLTALEHSDDHFMHAAFASDRLRLRPLPLPPSLPGGPPRLPAPLPPAAEVLGLIENPLRRAGTDPVARHSGELFHLVRRGFERALLQVRITGMGETALLTFGPLLINRDEGHGVGFAGIVPLNSVLVFDESGRVTLDGADVTSFAFAFQGATFADANAPDAEQDAVFDTDLFAIATPDGALDRSFAFPHSGESIPMPGVAIGVTRFAYFANEAYFAAGDGPTVVPVTPRPFQGIYDGSVYGALPGSDPPKSARVALSWIEHEAYKIRLMIPPRFRQFEDDPEAPELRRRLAQAVNRFRPAGVALEIGFIDEHWVLGDGVLGEAGGSALAALTAGMMLWPAPAGG